MKPSTMNVSSSSTIAAGTGRWRWSSAGVVGWPDAALTPRQSARSGPRPKWRWHHHLQQREARPPSTPHRPHLSHLDLLPASSTASMSRGAGPAGPDLDPAGQRLHEQRETRTRRQARSVPDVDHRALGVTIGEEVQIGMAARRRARAAAAYRCPARGSLEAAPAGSVGVLELLERGLRGDGGGKSSGGSPLVVPHACLLLGLLALCGHLSVLVQAPALEVAFSFSRVRRTRVRALQLVGLPVEVEVQAEVGPVVMARS